MPSGPVKNKVDGKGSTQQAHTYPDDGVSVTFCVELLHEVIVRDPLAVSNLDLLTVQGNVPLPTGIGPATPDEFVRYDPPPIVTVAPGRTPLRHPFTLNVAVPAVLEVG